MKNILKKTLFKLPKNVRNNLYKVYDFLLYPENRERKVCLGKNNIDKTFYIIRPRKNTVEGLMSLLLNTTRHLKYVDEKKYIPYFDFKSLSTQYSNDNNNIWDYYFEQSQTSFEEISNSKNVIYGGLSVTRTSLFDFDNWTKKEQIKESKRLFDKYIFLNKKTKEYIDNEMKNINTEGVLGLYLRGTDYTKLKPAGHPKQPEINDAFNKANEFIVKYNLHKVFLVTEDYDIYTKALDFFGDKLIIASFDSFIKNYKGKEFLSDSKSMNDISDDKYVRGLNYLAKIVILSKCDYLVAGNTCGSWAATSFSKGFKDYYIFNLGNY